MVNWLDTGQVADAVRQPESVREGLQCLCAEALVSRENLLSNSCPISKFVSSGLAIHQKCPHSEDSPLCLVARHANEGESGRKPALRGKRSRIESSSN